MRNEWDNTTYPVVPGHEIVGRVTKSAAEVSKFKAGDLAGVGCMVNSCRECESCKAGLENYCERGATFTYNSRRQTSGRHDLRRLLGLDCRGRGLSSCEFQKNLDLAAVAPLLCAGITTYSPLRHWKAGKGQKVGVVGLGGLGHMALKLAHAMGAHVVLFTTSTHKSRRRQAPGRRRSRAYRRIASQLEKHVNSFDLILDTVSAEHDLNPYLNLLKRDATMVLVGAPEKPVPVAAFSLIPKRRQFAGSMIGGIPETQEMLDFCGKHGIASDVEIIPDPEDQRGLRTHAEERREVSLRDRHVVAQVVPERRGVALRETNWAFPARGPLSGE